MLTPRQKYEVCRVKSGTVVFPVTNMQRFLIGVSTRFRNIVVDGENVTTPKNNDFVTHHGEGFLKNYSPNLNGNANIFLPQGVRDVYSLNVDSAYKIGNYNIQNFGNWIRQFPNLYSLRIHLYSYQSYTDVVKGDLSQIPDSLEKFLILDFEVANRFTDVWLNLSNFSTTAKLKYLFFSGYYVGNPRKVIGDLAKLPPLINYFKINALTADSSITYTSGKVWASSFDTLSIPISLGNFLELDALFTDMGNSITSAVGDKVISLGNGWVTQKSLAQRNYLTALGFTLSSFLDTSTGTASSTTQKFIGDISKIPSDVKFFKILQCAGGSAITYTSGKTWASAFDTLSIPLPLTTAELDSLLIDMNNSITTKLGAGVIALEGYRSAISDAAVASLQAKGFTVNVQKYSITPQKILDLAFQNNFTDTSSSALTMVAGGTSNAPTFALSGRKAGEYCAVFNGSQSIKTTTNLPVNSDKVTIAFWMKTTQASLAMITELSVNAGSNNAFYATHYENVNGVVVKDRSSVENIKGVSFSGNDGSWRHIVIVVDRNLNANNSTSIYVNSVKLSLSTMYSANAETTGNFGNYLLFIGQRAGNSLGFNGSLTRLKIYNYPFTPTEVTNLYNSEV